ncbi:MAG: NUDIX hydrolase [Bacteroidota bacterium]
MEKHKGSWVVKSSDSLFKDDFLELQQDEVIRPDGTPGKYATVRMKPGVAILALEQPGNTVFLTRQFRYALGKASTEVVGGGIDEAETPEEAAKREIREELGIIAEEWISLGYFEMDTSIVQNPVYLFICQKLSFTQTDMDDTEAIQMLKTPFSEAVQMVMDGRIVHGISCVLLLKASKYLAKKQ